MIQQLPVITELSLKYIPYPTNGGIPCEHESGCYGMSMKGVLVTPAGRTTIHGRGARFTTSQSIAESILELTKMHEEAYKAQCDCYAETGSVTHHSKELHDAAARSI